MRLVQAHMAEFKTPQINENDLVRLLQHLHAGLEKNVGHPGGPAPVAWSWVGHIGQRGFPTSFYDRRRLGLQDRIGVITDKFGGASRPVRAMQSVEDRPRSRCWRLDAGKIWMHPHPRKVRGGCGAFLI